MGFVRGRAATKVFHHPRAGVRLVVWGDDFTFLGREKDLGEITQEMRRWYEIKVRAVVGPDPEDQKEVGILNRLLKWKSDRITYQGDDKRRTTILKGLGLQEDSKGVKVPVEKDDVEEDESDELDIQQAKLCRSLAATVNYMAADRPDLQFAARVLGRSMSRPTEKSWAKLKRVGRYLVIHPTVIYEFGAEDVEDIQEVVAWSDSDWAGCRTTRRSMSGGLITMGSGAMKSWANRQASVALSSGEAEFYAAGKAASEALYARAVLKDLGWPLQVRLIVDASAAQGMASRQGVGKVRHLEVRYLWLQDLVKSGTVRISKVWGKLNPADVLTKPMSFEDAMGLLSRVRLVSP